jgi:hypothetical protein
MPLLPGLNRANYCKILGNNRRLDLMTRLAPAMRQKHLSGLRTHDDLLAAFPELNGIEAWAGDGHAMTHATHDPRNGKDAYTPVHAIYKLDLRTGWVGLVDLVPPTDSGREYEIKTLKRQDSWNIEYTKVINAWQMDLTKRVETAREADQTLPVELYQALYRPTEVSLQIIRWLRSMLVRPTSYRAALETLRLLMLKSM